MEDVGQVVETADVPVKTKHIPYAEVNGTWPSGSLPKLDGKEAIKAARLLMREGLRFHEVRFKLRRKFILTSGRRDNNLYSNPRVINPDQGWHDLVHSISHWVHRRANPKWEQHQLHAMTEKHLIEHVVNNGWLDGKLKRPEKPKVEVDQRAVRLARVEARLASWKTKAKRAATMLKKLEKQRRYYEEREPFKPRAPRAKLGPLKDRCLALAEKLNVEIAENDIRHGQHWVYPNSIPEDEDKIGGDSHYVDGWRGVIERLKAYEVVMEKKS